MDIQQIETLFFQSLSIAMDWASSPKFYSQIGLIVLASLLAYSIASFLKNRSPLLRQLPASGPLLKFRNSIYRSRDLILPLMLIMAFSVAADISHLWIGQSWLIQVCMSWAVIFMLYKLIDRLVHKALFKKLALWVILPIAILHLFGWLDTVIAYLESMSFQVGNINISAYGIVRVLIFGSILFWLGRISSNAGQQIIRSQEDLDIGTREVFA